MKMTSQHLRSSLSPRVPAGRGRSVPLTQRTSATTHSRGSCSPQAQKHTPRVLRQRDKERHKTERGGYLSVSRNQKNKPKSKTKEVTT